MINSSNHELDLGLVAGALAIVGVIAATGVCASLSQSRQESPQAISATNSSAPHGVTVGSSTMRPSERQSPATR